MEPREATQVEAINAATEEKAGEFITLEPYWPNVLRFFATGLVMHDFERGAYAPVVSLIEQVRYLHQTDPQELAKILEELRGRP